MMNFYNDIDKWAKRGVDYDLFACLENNPQDAFMVADIRRVLAVWEGANDGDDWRWVIELFDGRFVFLRGGCDYTGWDCRSSASHWTAVSPEESAELEVTNDRGYEWRPPSTEVRDSLLFQIAKGKNETWREKTDKDFGLTGDEPMLPKR